MKRLSFFALSLCALLLVGCSSDQKKTETLVAKYLKEHLKDPASYESVYFSKLDTIYSTLNNDSTLGELRQQLGKAIITMNDLKELKLINYTTREGYFEEIEKSKHQQDSLYKILIAYEENYVPSFNGYKVTHKYRAKNGFGALDFGEQEFYTNKDITEILETKKIE